MTKKRGGAAGDSDEPSGGALNPLAAMDASGSSVSTDAGSDDWALARLAAILARPARLRSSCCARDLAASSAPCCSKLRIKARRSASGSPRHQRPVRRDIIDNVPHALVDEQPRLFGHELGREPVKHILRRGLRDGPDEVARDVVFAAQKGDGRQVEEEVVGREVGDGDGQGGRRVGHPAVDRRRVWDNRVSLYHIAANDSVAHRAAPSVHKSCYMCVVITTRGWSGD